MPLRSSRGRKLASATTRARERRARENRAAVLAVLRAGHVLRVSSRTDVAAGTVHAGLARKLVAEGQARYPTHPTREGWNDVSQIKGTS